MKKILFSCFIVDDHRKEISLLGDDASGGVVRGELLRK